MKKCGELDDIGLNNLSSASDGYVSKHQSCVTRHTEVNKKLLLTDDHFQCDFRIITKAYKNWPLSCFHNIVVKASTINIQFIFDAQTLTTFSLFSSTILDACRTTQKCSHNCSSILYTLNGLQSS